MGNFLKANTADTSGLWGALPSLNQYANQVADDAVKLGMPATPDLNANDLNKMIETFSNLNTLKSRQDERQYNPEAAAAREAFEKQTTANVAGGLDPRTQRGLSQLGITNAINTGMAVAPGTAGQSQVANLYGRGADAEFARRRAEAENLYGNQAAQTGLSPEAAGNIQVQNRTGAANAINTGRQTLMNAANAMVGNTYGQFQQGGQMAGQQAQNNASAQNQAMGQSLGALTSLATAPMKAMGGGGGM